MAYVSRDSFAREELHKRIVKSPHYDSLLPTNSKFSCRWCGNTRKGGTLYQYFVESDSGRKSDIDGHFCSASCIRSFHS